MGIASKYDYDFFIAYAGPDFAYGMDLANVLGKNYRIFIDKSELKASSVWAETIQEAQFSSMCSIILITSSTETSFYQKEEIAMAIRLFNEHNRTHLIIPIFIGDFKQIKIPYGLHSIHGIHVPTWKPIEITEEIIKAINHFKKDDYFGYNYSKPMDYGIIQPDRVAKTTSSRMPLHERLSFEKYAYGFILRHSKSLLISQVVYIDVDGVTQINRQFGRNAGDTMITRLEKIIYSHANATYIKKIGNDEFIIFYEDCGTNDLFKRITVLRKKIKDYNWENIAPGLFVTACYGYVELHQFNIQKSTKTTLNNLMLRAIEGCLLAKKKGRDKMQVGPLHLSVTRDVEENFWSLGSGD